MASIKDVATKAGVSLSTVSIVVNGKSEERKISEATQEKVMKAMRELHYVPNVSAKTLRRGDSQKYVIALFWSFDFRSIMMIRFLSGLQQKIDENGSNMSIVIRPYQTGELYKESACFNGSEFHAAIIANANNEDLAFLEGESFPVPIVLYNRLLDKYSSVNVDDDAIGRAAAAHLYEKGYRNPMIIHGIKNFPGATSRENAFLGQMEAFGIHIPPEQIVNADNSLRGGADCAERLLKEGGLPDSFWCSSDAIALGLTNALVQRGIRVPQEAGILAVGSIDPQFSIYNNPPITVIDIPMEKMGGGCYEHLKGTMDNCMTKVRKRYYDTQLYMRKSTDRG